MDSNDNMNFKNDNLLDFVFKTRYIYRNQVVGNIQGRFIDSSIKGVITKEVMDKSIDNIIEYNKYMMNL